MGVGGAGVSNAQGATIGSLINQATGTIGGGRRGVSNAGTIKQLTNSGKIPGAGADPPTAPARAAQHIATTVDHVTDQERRDQRRQGSDGPYGGPGGDGVPNAGTITLAVPTAARSPAATATAPRGLGGAGVSNAGSVTALTNSGKSASGSGGGGGTGGRAAPRVARREITSLTNKGAMGGANDGPLLAGQGCGGAVMSNAGTITSLSNNGSSSSRCAAPHAACPAWAARAAREFPTPERSRR